jgi:hypothetical protein
MTDPKKPTELNDTDLDDVAGAGTKMLESVSDGVVFKKLEINLQVQKPDGALTHKGGNVETSWKVEEGEK